MDRLCAAPHGGRPRIVPAERSAGPALGLWHLPAIDYLGTASPHGSYLIPFFLAFTAAMTALRALMAWIFAGTGSLLLAQLIHAGSTGALVVLSPRAVTAAAGRCSYLHRQHRYRPSTNTLDGKRSRFTMLPGCNYIQQRQIVVRCWNRKQRLPAQLLVVDERLVFTGDHHLFRFRLEANRPLIRIGHVSPPRVSAQIVHDVAAAHNQNALDTQRREFSAEFEMGAAGWVSSI